MTKKDAMDAIKELGRSKGFYMRLYTTLAELPDSLMEDFWRQVEGCEDIVDLVTLIEE